MSVRGESGQATIIMVWLLVLVAAGALLLGGVARGIGAGNDRQRAADLAALAGAREMHARFSGLFMAGGGHVELAAYRAAAERAARETARRNGMDRVRVTFPDDGSFAPVQIRVVVDDAIAVGDRRVRHRATADAELAPPADVAFADGAGEYTGPLATRQGKQMRPDVAAAFDRMHAAATRAGVALTITSAYRSNAEQAELFARNPDPKWVARPGTSLHRLGTELDLGPPGAYGWLAANAKRFGFIQRYSWELVGLAQSRARGMRSRHSAMQHGARGPRSPNLVRSIGLEAVTLEGHRGVYAPDGRALAGGLVRPSTSPMIEARRNGRWVTSVPPGGAGASPPTLLGDASGVRIFSRRVIATFGVHQLYRRRPNVGRVAWLGLGGDRS